MMSHHSGFWKSPNPQVPSFLFVDKVYLGASLSMLPFLIRPYESLNANCKPKASEFTVCASIAAIHKTDPTRSHTLVVATGTKSLNIDNDTSGCLLADSHAEVICRRAFIRYLLKCYRIFQDASNRNSAAEKWILNSNKCLFEVVPHQHDDGIPRQRFMSMNRFKKLRLKSEWSIEMFISDPPCGDASIYPTHSTSDETSTHQSNPHVSNFTGAKLMMTLEGGLSIDKEENGQCYNCLRLKPGRSDIPIDRRSMSKSCSDKLCRWSVVGLQGTFLSALFEPVYLSRVSVCRDPAAITVSDQRHACDRAINHRFTSPDGMLKERTNVLVEVEDVTHYILEHRIDGKLSGFGKALSQYLDRAASTEVTIQSSEPVAKRSRQESSDANVSTSLLPLVPSSALRPCGVAFNWVIDVASPADTSSDVMEGRLKHVRKCNGGTIEMLQSQNGSLLGVTSGNKGKPEYSSRLCRRNFVTAFIDTVRVESVSLISGVAVAEGDAKPQHTYRDCKNHFAELSGYTSKLSQFKQLPGFSQWDAHSLKSADITRSSFFVDV